MIDTGLRLAELANLGYSPTDEDLSDVDLDGNTVTVMGKGSRIRVVRIGAKAVQALDRYLRERARHPHRHSEWLWLAQKGRLTDSGTYQVVRRRAQRAGIGPINPHEFRHTFAHLWLDSGGSEGDLMRLAGWRTRQMVGRYAPARPPAVPARPTNASPPATDSDDDKGTSMHNQKLGIEIGAGVGVALDNLALGLGVGTAIGVALGAGLSSSGRGHGR